MTKHYPRTQRLRLDARLTYQFAQGWAHEDQWVDLAVVKLTGLTRVQSASYDDDTTTVRHLLSLDAASWAQAKAVYRRYKPETQRWQSFTQWLANMAGEHFSRGCQCEHDCCGHLQTSASARYIGKRRLSLELRSYHNV